jgi:bacillithiol system protein YtxJ
MLRTDGAPTHRPEATANAHHPGIGNRCWRGAIAAAGAVATTGLARQFASRPDAAVTETILHDLAAFDRALATHPRVLLFKHSPTCPISADARDAYEAFRANLPDAPTLFVDVVADRPVARGIAERCGVRHESPQAILFELGQPVWHASHDAITVDALHAAFAPRC